MVLQYSALFVTFKSFKSPGGTAMTATATTSAQSASRIHLLSMVVQGATFDASVVNIRRVRLPVVHLGTAPPYSDAPSATTSIRCACARILEASSCHATNISLDKNDAPIQFGCPRRLKVFQRSPKMKIRIPSVHVVLPMVWSSGKCTLCGNLEASRLIWVAMQSLVSFARLISDGN